MLNTEGFVLLAGNPKKWDLDTLKRVRPGRYDGTFNSDDLCKVQVDHHFKGFRTMQLLETVYGWSVRSGSNLDGRSILTPRGLTLRQALDAGKDWANADPDNREFIAYRSDAAKFGFLNEEIPYKLDALTPTDYEGFES